MVSLIGGTIMLFSCKDQSVVKNANLETMITHQTDSLTMVNSVNGVLKYRFETPLMERYELAREPYVEFRQGLYLINYDTLGQVASTLVADYAIYYEKRELWEARGNVVSASSDGRTLYTEQLFWDEKTGRIYSNVHSKVVDGFDIVEGEGFESDDEFENWEFRNYEGRMWVDTSEEEGTSDKNDEDGEDGDVEKGEAKAKPEEKPEKKPEPKPKDGSNKKVKRLEPKQKPSDLNMKAIPLQMNKKSDGEMMEADINVQEMKIND